MNLLVGVFVISEKGITNGSNRKHQIVGADWDELQMDLFVKRYWNESYSGAI